MKPIAIHLAEKLEDLPSTGNWLLINNAAAELRRLQAEAERLNTTPPAQPAETAPKDFYTEFDGWNGKRVPVPLTDDELDLCRQWFDSTQDTNGDYLNVHDYALAEKLYLHLGLRVPYSVKHAIPPAAPTAQPAKAPKEYTRGNWFNDLENPHGNR
jgi:hypothetical protein